MMKNNPFDRKPKKSFRNHGNAQPNCSQIKFIRIFDRPYKFDEHCQDGWLNQLKEIEGIYQLDLEEDNIDSCFLGQGGNGFVLRYKIENERYAIKFLTDEDNTTKEIKIHKAIQDLYTDPYSAHYRIPRFHKNGKTLFNGKELFYIVMDSADRSFKDFLCEIHTDEDREDKLRFMFKYLSETLSVLHASDYIHRDIKPENILIKENYPLLADFGMTGKKENCLRKKGPKYWPNPEFIEVCDRHLQIIDQKSDIFNLGCLFFYFATGKYPIGRIDLDQELASYDERLKETILSMLHYEKSNRMADLSEIITAM